MCTVVKTMISDLCSIYFSFTLIYEADLANKFGYFAQTCMHFNKQTKTKLVCHSSVSRKKEIAQTEHIANNANMSTKTSHIVVDTSL